MALAISPSALAQTETILHNFTMSTGVLPNSGVVFDTHGNLYGTAVDGGRQDVGTLFELSPLSGGTWTYNVLHNFSYGVTSDGYYPESTPIVDTAGNLYGTTVWGGANNAGTVYEMVSQSNGSWNEKLIYSFNGTDGQFVQSSLTLDASGNLYGTTSYGGSTYGSECIGAAESGCGVVFQLKPEANGGWAEKVLWSFSKDGTDGYIPWGGVILDSAGNLYGTTLYGGAYGYGMVYELSPTPSGTWTETIMHNFDHNGADGFYPNTGKLIFDAEGNLYGSTQDGGSGGNNPRGTIYELSPSSGGIWTEKILQTFQAAGGDGGVPNGSLIFDASGNIYGTASTGGGGNFHLGTVFELSPHENGTWSLTALHRFEYYPDGAFPVSGVIMDGAGNLYGTTENGGTGGNIQCSYYRCGTVFEITP